MQTTVPKPWERKQGEPVKPAWLKNTPPPKPPAPGADLVSNGKRKPGRPRAIPDPEALLTAAEAYVEWAEANPIKKPRSALHDGKPVHWEEEIKRPLTKMGFQAFLGISERTMYRLLSEEQNPEMVATAEAVFRMFDSELLEGGVAKLYDGGLIARILQLADSINTNAPPPVASTIDPMDVPDKVHPDDPDPFGEHPLRFTQRQLDAGIQYPMKVIEGEEAEDA